jgi:DNA-binding CsgD family transcriptional regulator
VPSLPRAGLVDRLRAEADAAATAGRLVLVSGEAGVGKTSLVRQALAPAVWGYCEPLSTPRPLGPLRDIATQLGQAPPSRPNALALADRLLQHQQQPGPAIVVEDAHWIDSSSAETLRFLGRRLSGTRGLVVVITRSDLPAASPVRVMVGDLGDAVIRLEVPALTEAEIVELAGDSGHDVAEVLRLTRGNAFLVQQLLTSGGAHPPASLGDSVAARLGRLGRPARELAELLSVVPGRASFDLVGEDWASLDEVVGAGILQVDDAAVEFRHELVRLAIADTLAPGRKRALHQRVLNRLVAAEAPEPAVIAHHARRAHDLETARAAEVAAAVRAVSLGSHREALEHYLRAVADARTSTAPAEQVRLLLLLADEQIAIGRDHDGRASAQEALRIAATLPDPLLRSAAARLLSRLEPAEADALQMAAAAVDSAASVEESAELAAAYANLATIRMLARDLTGAATMAERARAAARRTGAVRAEVIAANALGSAQLLQGDLAGRDALRQAIHLGAAHGFDQEVGRAYANLVSAAGEARLYDVSATSNREALRYFKARDLDGLATYTQAWNARCLFEQGRWDEAAPQLAALAATELTHNTISQLAVLCATARLHIRRGSDPADVGGRLNEARALARSSGSLQRLAPVAAAQAESVWLSGGDDPATVELLSDTYRLARDRDSPWTVGELGFWLWRLGALDELPPYAAAPYRYWVNGDVRAASAAWRAIGCRYEEAEALTDSAEVADVQAGLRGLTELGARPARQRAARRLRELGVRSIPRGPRETTGRHPAGLTTRETEVLAWLRDGATDAEIASGLHLSVRTVEHHVAAILRKTGVGSRRALRDS